MKLSALTSSAQERSALVDLLALTGIYWHGQKRYTGNLVESEFPWRSYPVLVVAETSVAGNAGYRGKGTVKELLSELAKVYGATPTFEEFTADINRSNFKVKVFADKVKCGCQTVTRANMELLEALVKAKTPVVAPVKRVKFDQGTYLFNLTKTNITAFKALLKQAKTRGWEELNLEKPLVCFCAATCCGYRVGSGLTGQYETLPNLEAVIEFLTGADEILVPAPVKPAEKMFHALTQEGYDARVEARNINVGGYKVPRPVFTKIMRIMRRLRA